jgi:CSLREA domain-containing protein
MKGKTSESGIVSLPLPTLSRLKLALLALAALLVLSLIMAKNAHADTFTVNTISDNDDGTCAAQFCSLREAINAANATAGPDTIDFDLNAGEVGTISPASALPTITDKVTVDGYSQPGASENTAITNANNAVLTVQLSGANAPPNTFGLAVSGAGAAGTKIRGLVINRFGGNGVFINAQNTIVEGNYIGTNAAGDADLGNGGDGVTLLSSGNLVGGPANAAQNVISGNGDNGVKISDTGATGNTISNNHIGTDADAGEDLGNSDNGVFVEDAPGNTVGGSSADGTLNIISGNDENGVRFFGVDASDSRILGNLIGLNLNGNGFSDIGNARDGVFISSTPQVEIGGTLAGQGNTISDNGGDGVTISGFSATNNRVLGNRIGTNTNGSSAFGNAGAGVRVVGPPNTTIGDTSAEARNVISGNRQNGVSISGGSNATNNEVLGNFIGTDDNGTSDLGNGGSGVRVEAPGTFVGGTTPGAGNLISGNTNQGVFIGSCTCATGNRILRNSIFDNGLLGIELGLNEDGPTPNDRKDRDTGPNKLQNFPVITSATATKINARLSSRPRRTFTVQFFSSPEKDPTNFGEAQNFLGQKTVRTSRKGKVSFAFSPPSLSAGEFVTATATDTTGNTSEFSQARVVG